MWSKTRLYIPSFVENGLLIPEILKVLSINEYGGLLGRVTQNSEKQA